MGEVKVLEQWRYTWSILFIDIDPSIAEAAGLPNEAGSDIVNTHYIILRRNHWFENGQGRLLLLRACREPSGRWQLDAPCDLLGDFIGQLKYVKRI